MYYYHANGTIQGAAVSHVDDTSNVGNENFRQLSATTLKIFEGKSTRRDGFTPAGKDIKSLPDHSITITHTRQVSKLTLLSLDASFGDFRSLCMQLGCLMHTRPQIAFIANQAAQVTREDFDVYHIKQFNAAIAAVEATPTRGLTFQKLDKDSQYTMCLTDSSFENNRDCTSQLGHIILACDKFQRCNDIAYRSYISPAE